MSVQGDINVLTALQIVASSAELIYAQVHEQRGNAAVTKRVAQVLDVIDRVRPQWPTLRQGTRERTRYVKTLENLYSGIRATKGLPAHALTWLSRMILEHVQGELWDHDSPKGGAINEVLRYVEDLHESIRPEHEEACRQQAEGIFLEWLSFVDGGTSVRPWRKIG